LKKGSREKNKQSFLDKNKKLTAFWLKIELKNEFDFVDKNNK
jgi:hypothetical protein